MGKKITAIVLTGGKPKKVLLDKCLKSLSWTNELIEFDSENISGSFSEWRNEGAKRANGDWLFYVDSDEEITKDLREEIERMTEESKYSGYAIPRRNYIFGKEFKHGGLWPDYVKRLFLRSKFEGWRGELHEEPKFIGKMGHLKSPMIHHKDINISEMVDKTNQWSEIEAKLMFEAGHPKMNFLRFFSAGMREFWLRMIKQKAFLDGKEGVIYALYQVYSRLISYAKLWEKQQ